MEYKVSELAEKAGVTKRTIHYYISKGLLLPPEGSGVNSVYNDEHLNRLLLIKKLQSEYMPLNKIREYILENPTEERKLEVTDHTAPSPFSGPPLFVFPEYITENKYSPERISASAD